MKFAIISSPSGIATTYPFDAYGGIERIAAELAHSLIGKGHEVKVLGYVGSDVPGAEVRTMYNEGDVMKLPDQYPEKDGHVLDFTHNKYYPHSKNSVPFWGDQLGKNPIFPTHAVKQAMGGAPTDPVIYPGIEPSDYQLMEKENYFLFLSKIALYKGVDFAIYLARRFKFKLIIAGHNHYVDADYFDHTMQNIKNDPYVEHVVIENKKHKAELFAKARGFLFPSNWSLLHYPIANPVESFGIVAVEAMMAGTPVFLHNIPGGPQEIITRESGMALDQHEWGKILTAKFDPEKVRERGLYFTADRYADDLVRYFDGRVSD